MQFVYLKDQPSAIETVAQWYFDQWGHLAAAETLAGVRANLERYLNRDRIPLVILAVADHEVVGAAQLKFREMAIYPEKEHWLGGVFVAPHHRGRGVGSALAGRIAEIARSLQVKTLHLQTECLDGGLYARLGWEPRERVTSKGRDVLVMEKDLGASRAQAADTGETERQRDRS